jgi:osmotically-inducible protein OsmY
MPKTYDEITRKTVPNPDSSFRPSPEQVKQAYEGFRALDTDEQALQQRVQAAIAGRGDVTVEVERDRVILRGRVRDAADLRRLPELVRGLEGVGSVDDQLVTG